MPFSGKTYWIIGASEGLGRALAQALAAKGAKLILSARSEEKLAELAASLPTTVRPLPLDVTDLAQMAKIAETPPAVDGMVYAAGVYWPMRTSEINRNEARQMIDINLTGAINATSAVMGDFLARDAGHLVYIGSLSAYRGLPGAIGYCASKAGLRSLAESVRADLHQTNVKVQIIHPGFIKTRLTDKNDFAMPFIQTPERAAHEVLRAMSKSRFESAFPRPFSWLFQLGAYLPSWLYFRLFGAKNSDF